MRAATPTAPGFDEWLNAAPIEETDRAGESVETYIGRAIAARTIIERARRGEGDVRESGLLDAERARSLDRIVGMVVSAVGVPSAAVTLIDRDTQYMCSAIGLTGEMAVKRQGPLKGSLGREVLVTGKPLVVADARKEPLLRDHWAVKERIVVAYAGFPLTDAQGHTIGTLIAWDTRPRRWMLGHVQVMEDFVMVLRARLFGVNPD